MPDDQSEVIAFLSNPATHGVDRVERIDTHCAHVFLAGETAWKIKRAVRYDYLDFSTLAKRKTILERELSLNAPAAPGLYRRVVPIRRTADDTLNFDGDGEPVEYALEMRRFPDGAQLDRVAEAGQLDDDLAAELGEVVASYHARAGVLTEDGAVLIREILEELGRVFAQMKSELGAELVDRFEKSSIAAFARLAPVLAGRSGDGHVRRCHSDLHLANLVLLDGHPVPFDALEFDERLGTCDTLYDIAFLVMDLLHRGLARQANLCLNAWLGATGDHAGLCALPLCLAVRAAIRAMVDVQTAGATGSDALLRDARRYLGEALAFLEPPPPGLVAIGGLSGTGKTTVARALAPKFGAAPGAVHLRSDVERKRLLGVAPLDRLHASAYDAATSARVYDHLAETARTCLAAGQAAILDATFLEPAERTAARAMADAAGVRFLGVWLTAPRKTLLSRVAARTSDASDADRAVLEAQFARDPGQPDWTRIAAGRAPDMVVADILSRLRAD